VSAELRGVVLAHGELAGAMVAAAEEISGVHDALLPVSNSGCDRARLEERLSNAIAGRQALVFVDLPSGSCFIAAMRAIGSLGPDVRVVTGTNLSMLIDFLFHRTLSLDEAATRAGDMGVRAIGER